MSKWLRGSTGLVVGAAAALLVGALTDPVSSWSTFAAFAGLIAVAELFEVTLPNEARYSLGLAPALGYTLLGDQGLEVVLAYGVGVTAAIFVRALTSRPLRVFEAATHTIALTLATVLYEVSRTVDPTQPFRSGPTALSGLGLLVTLAAVLLAPATLVAIRAAEGQRIPALPVMRSLIASTAALQLSVVSVGALLALAYPELGFYAFALFLAPLAATHFAFRQFAEIRKTYLQTIRALSKVPEMAGYTRPGHSSRVAEMTVAIAREMGLGENQVNEMEYAALLHDIGRISIPDPEEPHAIEPQELAQVGATIVRETGHFPHVASMIERQPDPYRHRGQDADPSLPAGARIIKVASAYDDLVHPGPLGLSVWDTLERLRQGMTFDYDPSVIQALSRVLEKHGAL